MILPITTYASHCILITKHLFKWLWKLYSGNMSKERISYFNLFTQTHVILSSGALREQQNAGAVVLADDMKSPAIEKLELVRKWSINTYKVSNSYCGYDVIHSYRYNLNKVSKMSLYACFFMFCVHSCSSLLFFVYFSYVVCLLSLPTVY